MVAAACAPPPSPAGAPAAPPAAIEAADQTVDSALVRDILLAEERGSSGSPALARGLAHTDPRIRAIAWRADRRVRDTLFMSRDSLPAVAAPPSWAEPAWRTRYRALAGRGDDCAAIAAALRDTTWQVRLRAVDLVTAQCAADTAIVGTLRRWVDSMPNGGIRRTPGGVSWHAAAHSLVALARLAPAEAAPRVRAAAAHPQRHLRRYAASAAAVLADTALLRSLARDTDPNAAAAAITALAGLTGSATAGGRADDSLFAALLSSPHLPVVHAAAQALEGTADPAARRAAADAFERWAARGSDSERDVRLALLAAAGRSATADTAAPVRADVAPDAVALALGADARLRITMADSTGGGTFVVRLRGDVAPLTAARVLELVRNGYYDGTTWHRVEPDFVIQGGSAGENEYVGHERYFRDELGTVPHVRGTVGMSTRGHDTGDAQWFVNLRDNLRLGQAYTVFAEVTEGMDAVDAVMEGDVIESIAPVGSR